MYIDGLIYSGKNSERATITTTIVNGSIFNETDTGNVYERKNNVWLYVKNIRPSEAIAIGSSIANNRINDTDISVYRSRFKRDYEKRSLIRAPAWAALTVYAVGAVVHHSNGEMMVCVSIAAGATSLASEPTFSATALIQEAAGPAWAYLGYSSYAPDGSYSAPTITGNQTAPAGSAIRLVVDPSLPGKLYSGTISGGSGYIDGIYSNVSFTGGSGSGAKALSVTVSGGAVSAITKFESGSGTGYIVGDILTIPNTSLGGSGSSFSYTITNILQDPSNAIISQLSNALTNATSTTIAGFNLNIGGSGTVIQSGTFTFGFITDDPKPAIVISGASSSVRVLVEVDGYDIEEANTLFTGSGTSYYSIDWSGVRKLRKYIIEVACSTVIRGLSLLPQSVLLPLNYNALRGLYLGDSYGNTISTYTTPMGMRDLGGEVFVRSGIRAVSHLQIGGTGYLNGKKSSDNNTTSTKYNCLGVLQENYYDYNPNVIVFGHGLNDITLTISDVVANALSCWKNVAKRYPNAIIIIFGPWSENSGPGATTTALDTALQEEFNKWNYEKSEYHSTISWITGTGLWGATTGTGNADFYIGADGSHPSFVGREYLIKKMTEYIDNDLKVRGL